MFFFLFVVKKNVFIYFWLCWVSAVVLGLSLAVASRGNSLVVARGLLIAVASLVVGHGLWGMGSGAQAQ